MNNIVFFGTEDFSLVALTLLVDANFPIVAVVTKPDSLRGRGHLLTSPSVKIYAEKHGIPVWQPQKLSEIEDKIAALGQPTGVLVSYGKIIPQTILDLFHPGIINLHPSLLPKYRGPSPIESAIAAGEPETGVSIIKLTADMDAGPVYKQLKFHLRGQETAEELYASLGSQGSQLLIDALPSIIRGTLLPENQDDSDASYCKILTKSDGHIDWNESAASIEAKIRAYHLWPQSRTLLGGVEVIITKAEVVDNNSGHAGSLTIDSNTLIVGTGSGALRILSVKPLGKKEMSVEAFLSGYKTRLAR